MFMTGLTDPFFLTAIMVFDRKPGTGDLGKGPQTKPFSIQVASFSVNKAPCTYKDSPLGTVVGGRGVFWKDLPPCEDLRTLFQLYVSGDR